MTTFCFITHTRSNGLLRGPTSSSCGELRIYYSVLVHLRPHWSSVVTFSSNLSYFQTNQKIKKKIFFKSKKSNNVLKIQKNPKKTSKKSIKQLKIKKKNIINYKNPEISQKIPKDHFFSKKNILLVLPSRNISKNSKRSLKKKKKYHLRFGI